LERRMGIKRKHQGISDSAALKANVGRERGLKTQLLEKKGRRTIRDVGTRNATFFEGTTKKKPQWS